MKDNIKKSRMVRCKHCGGPMRLYRDGINCLMCGRTPEHSCERCRFADAAAKEPAQKEVA